MKMEKINLLEKFERLPAGVPNTGDVKNEITLEKVTRI